VPQPLSIAIIGAGTAGASTALLLQRQGHRVTVYEAVAEPRPVGAGITLQPSGMAVLAELGLLEPIVARGAVLSGLDAHTRSGRTVVSISYRQLHPQAFGLGVHRGLLFETLYNAVLAAGIEVITGCMIESLAPAGAHTRYVVDRGGRRHGPHDLVVIADGARSELRDDTRLTRSETVYPWGALWFMGRNVSGHYPQRITQVLRGTRQMIGFLPTGLGPAGNEPYTSLFWSFEIAREQEWRERGLEAFKNDVLDLSPLAAPILDQIHSIDDILLARYRDVVMFPWHAPGVVYIGDAAHATSPQLGQGANLALVDATVLASCLAESGEVAVALDAYSRRRRDSLRYYQFATRWLTPFFQSGVTPLGWLRDAFLGPSCCVPYVRNRMLRTMGGLETGFFSRPLPVPQLALPAS
jgi:2-polyprenyl-6-methoxyphenol hydroxylase-like FAD-dependent oxidoreductase